MTPKSVHEAFNLSSLAHDDPWDAPLIYPLELVACKGGEGPLLIISYDYSSKPQASKASRSFSPWGRRAAKGPAIDNRRVDMGIERIKTHFTHCNLTLLRRPGEKPICVSFGAACQAEILKDGKFQHLNPEMHKERAIFAQLDQMNPLECVIGGSVEYLFKGGVYKEGGRQADAHITTRLTDEQFEKALGVIQSWTEKPPPYALRPVSGENCRGLVNAVLDAIGVRKPEGWGILNFCNVDLPWWDTICLNYLAQGKLTSYSNWLVQPPAVTREMLAALEPTVAERKLLRAASARADETTPGKPPILLPQPRPEELVA